VAGDLRRRLILWKMRGTIHSMRRHLLDITEKGIVVYPKRMLRVCRGGGRNSLKPIRSGSMYPSASLPISSEELPSVLRSNFDVCNYNHGGILYPDRTLIILIPSILAGSN